MSNIGPVGLVLILLVALLLFGPNKLPELGRAFGRTLREFKAGAREIMEDPKTDRQQEEQDKSATTQTSSTAAKDRQLPE